MERRLILASASPRRAELLAAMGLRFDVVVSNADETAVPGSSPAEAAVTIAFSKALQVQHIHPDSVVLGADTMVILGDPYQKDGVVYYAKPADPEDAARMLTELSGRTHHVVTGVAVVWRASDGRLCGRMEAVATRVQFRVLTTQEIAAYVATGEPMDKAGAYAIQGGAAAFVERVEGDYYNVVGLSLASVRRLLRGLVRDVGRVPPVPRVPFPIASC